MAMKEYEVSSYGYYCYELAEEIEIIHAYEEPEFGIPFFKVKFRGFNDAQVINLKEV